MALPGRSHKTQPDLIDHSLYEIQSRLRIYQLEVFWIDKAEKRRFIQRSLIVTIANESNIRSQIENLLKDVQTKTTTEERDLDYELVEGISSPQSFDGTILALTGELVVKARSPRTGRVYDDLSMKYCPHTGVNLTWVIADTNPAPVSNMCPLAWTEDI